MNVVYKYGKRYIESENGEQDLRELMELSDDLMGEETYGKSYAELKAEPIVKWGSELLNDRGFYGGVSPDEVLVLDDELADALSGMAISEDEQSELDDATDRGDYWYGWIDILRVAKNLERGELYQKLMNIIEETKLGKD